MNAIKTSIWMAALLTVAIPSVLSGQIPLGTGFTYQGQFKRNGVPLNGSCNLFFDLYDAEQDGTQLGTQFYSLYPISSGLITVVLNEDGEFGPDAFNGEKRWLEITVQCPGDPKPTTLTPRQELMPTPYAHFAKAAPWDGLIGVPAQLPQSCGNDEIAKWNELAEQWECAADNDTLYTGENFALSDQACIAGEVVTGINASGFPICAPDPELWTQDGDDIFYANGSVGIGTATPTEELTVAGTVESTSGGFKFPDGSVQFTAAQPAAVPVGTVLPFVGNPAGLEGSGWVLCNGSSFPEDTDAFLTSTLGANTPNLMTSGGIFLAGISPFVPGQTGGQSDIPSEPEHTHAGPNAAASNASDRDGDCGNCPLKSVWLANGSPLQNLQTGSGGAHDHGGENRPPFYGVMYIMRIN